MKLIEKTIAKLALASAKAGAGSGSVWMAYQPKEPDMKKLCK